MTILSTVPIQSHIFSNLFVEKSSRSFPIINLKSSTKPWKLQVEDEIFFRVYSQKQTNFKKEFKSYRPKITPTKFSTSLVKENFISCGIPKKEFK
jgi:hypothetical protein